MFTKLSAISAPDTANVHCFCRDSVTNQGMKDNTDATDAPSPNSTSSEGNAQNTVAC